MSSLKTSSGGTIISAAKLDIWNLAHLFAIFSLMPVTQVGGPFVMGKKLVETGM